MTERRRPTSYRLGPDTLDLIARLSLHLPDDMGRPRSAADVLRLAVRQLAEHARLPGLPRGRGRIPKNENPK